MTEPCGRLDVLAFRAIGAAIEVHKHLGPGFMESVDEHALAFELQLRGIAFERQKSISIKYKGQAVGEHRVDFLIASGLIVELKSVDSLGPFHRAQLISYLKAFDVQIGLLINFNERLLKNGIERVVLT